MLVRPSRRLLVPVLSAALCAVPLAGCAGDDAVTTDAAAVTTPTAASSGAAVPTLSPAPADSAAASASAAPAVRTVEVAYAGGEVTGTSGREEVPVGEPVVLRITSDVAEQVHVHGYDLEQPVPAGGTVDIPVDATIPGVFEVELHDSGKVLFQLRVA